MVGHIALLLCEDLVAHDGPGGQEEAGGDSEGRDELPPHPEDLEIRSFNVSY